MSDDILRNCAALTALKRHQLVSLSKKYGLKASGKNVDMIDRLQKYGQKHAGNLDFYVPDPVPTPYQDLTILSSVSAAHQRKIGDETPDLRIPAPSFSFSSLTHKPYDNNLISRASDSWEVLSESTASIVSKKENTEQPESSSQFHNVGSWKSSNNGEALTGPEGNALDCDTRNSRSMKALTSSLSKRGSIILLGRDRLTSSASSDQHNQEAVTKEVTTGDQEKGEDHQEIVANTPSPASTVGIPRRYSRHTLQERPSTIRLCSPTPSSFDQHAKPLSDEDGLPFVGRVKDASLLKERRSMAPLARRDRSGDARPPVRKSMPALSLSTAASISSVYPPLPTISPHYMDLDQTCEQQEECPQVPGGFPPIPPSQSKTLILFDNSVPPSLSNTQFSEAAQNILEEMNARLPQGSARLGAELLKGKHAEIEKLVHTNQQLGMRGWGLTESTAHDNDRYAESHRKEFAKMKSISKTPLAFSQNTSKSASIASARQEVTAPLCERSNGTKRKLGQPSSSANDIPSGLDSMSFGVLEGNDERRAKRSRLSTHAFGTLREAKKNMAVMLGEEKSIPQTSLMRKLKDRRERRRSGFPDKNSPKRFGFLKKKTTTEPAVTLASSSLARKPIISHPRPLSSKVSTEVSHASRSSPQLSQSQGRQVRNLKNGGRTTSAQTAISQSSSKTPRRAAIPDFAPPSTTKQEASDKTSLVSTNSLGGIPKPPSPSRRCSNSSSNRGSWTTRAIKRHTQAELIRNARSAPPPPKYESINKADYVLAVTQKVSTASLGPTTTPPPSVVQSDSTLFLPTISSLARMQATVRPKADISLPKIPSTPSALVTPAKQQKRVKLEREGDSVEMVASSFSIKTIQPFGNASSRDKAFETNFMSKPAATPCKGGAGHGKGIMKKQSSAGLAAAARARAKSSGLRAVKSRGDLREKEKEMKRKKEEMRVLSSRRKEERELKEMLGM
ncbi:hypothetical protein C351_03917 [Cryptococcus neoformans c8]|nr:hypothetical protein C353_04039 [Cryptococcus neoformans var. grubii AD1-83a]OXG56683.1 hypothetical protein C354_03972 [Cryptococcus neoformans var. grubii MW-RSA1955]OXG62015.1 hypothetical protein C351_03917 [Cryptococcus neoformans var. grubii c8]OXH08527.1 hypothetical protein C369_04010 [Cryptococcus neoformans var. grubii A5-35-17]OXH10029.1 hypothetical protein C370_04082 [Cryptococcus neoformans var. grubii A1-35-8]